MSRVLGLADSARDKVSNASRNPPPESVVPNLQIRDSEARDRKFSSDKALEESELRTLMRLHHANTRLSVLTGERPLHRRDAEASRRPTPGPDQGGWSVS